jgi:hypothetical protein
MSYYTLPKNLNLLCVNPKYDNADCKVYSSYSLYNFYNNIKNEIQENCIKEQTLPFNSFDELIKLVHPYEHIFSTVKGFKYSVSKLKPQTNVFYDLLEIFVSLNIFNLYIDKPIKSLHMSSNYEDSNMCIQLMREKQNDDVFINYTNSNEEMYNNINNAKFDFMFFNKPQPNLKLYIINLIEIIMIIFRYQSVGGTSVIKIDTIFHKPVFDIIYLLSSLFEQIYIVKPNTSNVTTHEKYIVCKNFNVVNNTKLETYKSNYYKLQNFIKNIDDKNVVSIIDYKIPRYFLNKIDEINIIIGQQQLEYMNQIINILKNKNKDEKIELIKKVNIQKSVSWCEKLKISHNKFFEKTNIFLPIIKDKALGHVDDHEVNDREVNDREVDQVDDDVTFIK